MLLDIVTILLGLLGLFFGGEWLIRASSRLATALGIPALIVGLTIVALGTSAPELVVCLVAAINGLSDIAIGNVVGSNIANIGLILGIAGLIRPIRVNLRLVRREIPIMIAISMLVFAMATDGEIGRLEGLLLVMGYGVFTYVLYATAPKQPRDSDLVAEVAEIEGTPVTITPLREFGSIVVSLVFLAGGAQLTVNGATSIARTVGISEIVIGLTLVAVGTSLPEIMTTAMAALRGHDDLGAGNAVGSNISNLLVILGVTALISPVAIDPGLLSFEFPVMVLFALVPIPFVLNQVLARWEAGVLLVAYIGFVALTLIVG
jgi:cation:H+ antiporter